MESNPSAGGDRVQIKRSPTIARSLLVGLGIAAAALLVCVRFWMREPRFEGRALSSWVDQFQGDPDSSSGASDPAVLAAIRAMGPAAHRRIFQSVQRRDARSREAWNGLRDSLGTLGRRLPRARIWSASRRWERMPRGRSRRSDPSPMRPIPGATTDPRRSRRCGRWRDAALDPRVLT